MTSKLMKIFALGMFLLMTQLTSFSQAALFDTLKIDRTTKIIGRYPHYDTTRRFEKYNFIIEDSAKIAEFIKNIKLGREVVNSSENPGFKLTVVKNHREIGVWSVNPTLGSVMTHDGHTYSFSLRQISRLGKSFPFAYYVKTKVFEDKSEYDRYLASQTQNENFLFNYKPLFRYEGSFEIKFKKTNKYSSPKAIHEHVQPLIEKIVGGDDYSLIYILDSRNRKSNNHFIMTIQGPKKLFEQLSVDEYKNENWQLSLEKGTFFYKLLPTSPMRNWANDDGQSTFVILLNICILALINALFSGQAGGRNFSPNCA